MMKKNILVAILLLAAFSFSDLHAKVTLPSVISDGMVLQRNSLVNIWGKADPGKQVKVNPSWDRQQYRTFADADGNWAVVINTSDAGGPYFMEINDGDKTFISDIFLGEVWLCSGQSNMEMKVNFFTVDNLETVLSSANDNIRMYTGKRNPTRDIQWDNAGEWKSAAPANTGDFSAVGYFFAKRIQEVLDVPVGIIHVSWGGSALKAWMSRELLESYMAVEPDNFNLESNEVYLEPTVLYNGMLSPVSPYTLKGFLWYQGETEIFSNQQEDYLKMFPAMVAEWRGLFRNENAPFYYVQIAPFEYEGEYGASCALMREVQLRCSDIIPNSAMAVTLDIGELKEIHPVRKKEVGDRLALQALTRDYGIENIPQSGPVLTGVDIQDGKLLLSFSNTYRCLMLKSQEPDGFEVAGADGNFYKAKASIKNFHKLEVWSEEVTEPFYIRYGYRNYFEAELFNNYYLPASSFRADINYKK